MKPQQIEGFNFLHRNLMDNDNPGGCILAHAPGSGKTFMIIRFVQSFLSKYPDARPLVVLPKGGLSTWKKEFQKWQIEDTPLLDLCSAGAKNRKQQLEILMSWKEKKSILFMDYAQFSTIVADNTDTTVSKSCKELLLHLPTILIMDEGHTSRNKKTDIIQSLPMVKTPRKVILSGTLHQNYAAIEGSIPTASSSSGSNEATKKDIRKPVLRKGSIPSCFKFIRLEGAHK